MSNDVAHKSGWQIFEVVFGVPFLVALVLHRIIPISLPRGIFTSTLTLIGILLIVVGIVLVVLARRELTKYGQPTDPGHPTSEIVTTGVFSLSRNPLYLGGVCLLAGISLTFKLLWSFVLLLPSIVICHSILIAPEERYLAAKFGEGYHLYAARVRRWLGRKQRWN